MASEKHVDVWQKLTEFCRAFILQLKINKFKILKRRNVLKKKTDLSLRNNQVKDNIYNDDL